MSMTASFLFIIGIILLIIIGIFIEWFIGKAIGKAISKGTGIVLGIILILFFPFLLTGIAIIVYSNKNQEILNISVSSLYERNVTPIENHHLSSLNRQYNLIESSSGKILINNNENVYKISKINLIDIFIDNNFEEYISIFENNKLTDLNIISELNEYDLEKLGINKMGDRKIMLKLFSELNTKKSSNTRKINGLTENGNLECPNCNRINPSNIQNCKHCGYKLIWKCPNCNRINPNTIYKCNYCDYRII